MTRDFSGSHSGLSSPLGSQTKEAGFWTWFRTNDERLFSFEQDRDRVFDDLAAAMGEVNPDLTFEFGPIQDGRREFVISAAGIKSAFPAVEALYAAAPKLERWVILKYRQRRRPINDLDFADTKVRARDVRYVLFKDNERPGKVGILLYLDGYREEERAAKWAQIGYLFLDEALGEFDVETKVGGVAFLPYGARHFEQARPLPDLPEEFDRYLLEKPRS